MKKIIVLTVIGMMLAVPAMAKLPFQPIMLKSNKVIGSNFLSLLPRIQTANLNATVNGNTVTVSFLANKFSYGSVLVDNDGQAMAIDTYGAPLTEIQENYGYATRINGEGLNTYHVISFELASGIYHLRPMINVNGTEILLSQELVVDIK